MARGTGLLAGRALRGGRWSLVGLALLVALGGGAALGAAMAAHRTDHAYGEYVDAADVSELVVNPSLRTAAMDEAIRGFEGVDSVHVDTLLFASALTTKATKISEASDEDSWVQTRGPVDGRFLDVDRPAVAEGRLPSGEREVFVSSDFRPELERLLGRQLDVGDTIEIGIFWPGVLDLAEGPDDVIEPLGVEQLRISGFGVLPNEVLPEELFPRQQLVVSPDVTQRYYCLEDIGDATDYQTAYLQLLPEDCSATYDYYSLSVPGGADGVLRVRQQFDETVERLNADMAPELQEQGVGYFYISQERADLDAAVRETVRPTVTTLQAFAVVAALATLTVAGLMVARQSRRQLEVHRSLRAVGATRTQIVLWSAVPLLLAAAAGVAGAVAIAFIVSPIGPIGTVRSVTPSPGRTLPGAVAVPATALLAASLAVVILAVLLRAAWRSRLGREPTRGVGRLTRLVRRSRPAVSTGMGAALDARRGGAGIAAMVGCVVATATAATAIVFGASLSELVDEPEAYGWPWDVAVVTGAGYGDTVLDVVDDRLAQDDVRDDVVGHTFYSFDPSIVLGERPAPMIFEWASDDAHVTELPVLEGRVPRAHGETLLGRDTADAVGLEIGDEVAIESREFGDLELTVVGIGVLPSVGPFVADHTGLGTGAFTIVDAESSEERTPALTGIWLRNGADPSAMVDRLEPDLRTWSALDETPVAHDGPVRSPEIVNVSELQLAPLLLGGLLLASLMLGLWLAVTLSVRDRRQELAVLRAVGFDGREVRRSVRWQGLTLIGAGIVVGIPLGIIGGRYAWTYFADRLGVEPTITIPLAWLAVEVAATLVLGLLAVALPARSAAHQSPAQELLVP